MARYRSYKNGIYGHRYKEYYIIKGEKNDFSILKADSSLLQDKLLDYEECEWFIDKYTATDEEMLIIKDLYQREIYQLSSLFIELMQKKNQEGLNENDTHLYMLVEKVRKRKAEDRTL